jgi:CheY-like chemotaxis protein
MKRREPKYKYQNAMLIDDNELDNFINEKTLEANYFAHKIYIATSAKSALEFVNNLIIMGAEHRSAFPEVLFVDINMPMMDGFQFIEHFKKITEKSSINPRLVILTSSVYHEDRQKAQRISEKIVVLNKPLTADMLAEL